MYLPILLAATFVAVPAAAQNRIDLVRPDAPALAAFGDAPVGVRTFVLTDPGRPDVVAAAEAEASAPVPTEDREITVEVWYPAAAGTGEGGTYAAMLRDGETEVTLQGIAVRDAAPAEGRYPLVIVSHGYPGNRYLMSHLGENLASKGYVVVAADHPESTYSDQGPFVSTLVNRPLDQAFLLDALATRDDEIGAIVDPERTGIVGYSMGGYGALVFGGAGLSEAATTRAEPAAFAPPRDLLDRHAAGSETLAGLVDPRVRAVIAIAPWGRNRDFWDADGLADFRKPLLLVAGDEDDVSEYDALREIFAETTGTTRHLLSFEGANHNAAAPIPAPEESWAMSQTLGWAPFEHYADAVWDSVRMNNVLQHFATAFFDLHLKGADRGAYLDLVEHAEDGVWAMADDGTPGPEHTYWTGFPDRTAKGLRFETRAPD